MILGTFWAQRLSPCLWGRDVYSWCCWGRKEAAVVTEELWCLPGSELTRTWLPVVPASLVWAREVVSDLGVKFQVLESRKWWSRAAGVTAVQRCCHHMAGMLTCMLPYSHSSYSINGTAWPQVLDGWLYLTSLFCSEWHDAASVQYCRCPSTGLHPAYCHSSHCCWDQATLPFSACCFCWVTSPCALLGSCTKLLFLHWCKTPSNPLARFEKRCMLSHGLEGRGAAALLCDTAFCFVSTGGISLGWAGGSTTSSQDQEGSFWALPGSCCCLSV